MKGRILIVTENEILLGNGRHIFSSRDNGVTWALEFSISCSLWLRILLNITLLSRLFRLGFHHFLKIDTHRFVCVFNKEVIWLDLETQKVIQRDRLKGSRPLSLILQNGALYYGEYRSNPERSPVHVWSADIEHRQWNTVLKLEGVRHIHGVYFDRFSQQFWVTTGDESNEASVVLCSPDFKQSTVLIKGSQQSRVVEPVFTKNFVYYASDAPDEVNFIYRYYRSTGEIRCLQQVGGPVYFGKAVGGVLFFSTVVEPSKINSQSEIELWASNDGEHWKCIDIYRKDCFSLKYFQYGQLALPGEHNNKNFFCYSEFATENHLKTHMLDIKKLQEKYFS